MIRRSIAVAMLASLGFAAAANAVPYLVEFHWSDPSGTFLGPYDFDLRDDAPTSVGPGSKSRGKSAEAHAKNAARKVYFWVSRDGFDWRRADFDVSSWSESGATARLKSRESDLWSAMADAYGWTADETGMLLNDAYVGLSSSEETWTGEFSARLVSVQLANQRSMGAVPEPGTLALLGVGLAGMGLALRSRRRS